MIEMLLAPSEHRVLYVEDDDNDIFFLRLAFGVVGIASALAVVKDGQAAMDYLAGAGSYANRIAYPLPSVVLLDLQLPVCDGMEVLRWIRATPKLKGIVVVMFTSSYHPRDVDTAYSLGVNSFVVKPVTLADRNQFAGELKAWWLERNHFTGSQVPQPSCHPEQRARRTA